MQIQGIIIFFSIPAASLCRRPARMCRRAASPDRPARRMQNAMRQNIKNISQKATRTKAETAKQKICLL